MGAAGTCQAPASLPATSPLADPQAYISCAAGIGQTPDSLHLSWQLAAVHQHMGCLTAAASALRTGHVPLHQCLKL